MPDPITAAAPENGPLLSAGDPSNGPLPSAEAPAAPRPACPAPANFRAEIEAYDRNAQSLVWPGPRYRMTYRVLGSGPPLVLVPGIAATYRGYALMLNTLADRFQTIVYDYPGDQPDDEARLRAIGHEHLVDDLLGLLDHLGLERVYLVGLSFGSTVTLAALRRDPDRFFKAAVQGAFARRPFTVPERVALWFGRRMPGRVRNLPLRDTILAYNHRCHFPTIIADRWPIYLEQNSATPIAALTHRLDLVSRLDLRPHLSGIETEVLLLQGNEDRLVGRSHFDELCALLPRARGVIMPLVGHQPHYTHAEALAHTIAEYFLPCAPGACPFEAECAASNQGCLHPEAGCGPSDCAHAAADPAAASRAANR